MKSKYAVLELRYEDTLHNKYLPYVMVWEFNTLVPYLTDLSITDMSICNVDTDFCKTLYVGDFNFMRYKCLAVLKVPKSCKKRLMCCVEKITKKEVLFK